MSAQKKVKHWLNVSKKFGIQLEEKQPVEFFFYTLYEEYASDLSIDLHLLGYTIYDMNQTSDQQWVITGVTPPINMDEKLFSFWVQKMEELATKNKARFDGWGTLFPG